VDFLYFLDYMLAPSIFKLYFVSPYETTVDEVHIVMTMRKLNLEVDLKSKKFQPSQGENSRTANYDYEPILQL
jgi:hypothetical protein